MKAHAFPQAGRRATVAIPEGTNSNRAEFSHDDGVNTIVWTSIILDSTFHPALLF